MNASTTPPPSPVPACSGASILTCAGWILNLFDPDYSLISVIEIAHGLAGEIRYNAQSPERETVAQHSALLCRWARMCRGRDHRTLAYHNAIKALVEKHGEPDWMVVAACLLFHDAPEAVLGDIVSPLKKRPEMSWFRALENVHMARCAERFGLPPITDPVWEFVEALDHAIVIDEKLALWPGVDVSDKPQSQGLGIGIPIISLERAEMEWLTEYEIVMRALRPELWGPAPAPQRKTVFDGGPHVRTTR